MFSALAYLPGGQLQLPLTCVDSKGMRGAKELGGQQMPCAGGQLVDANPTVLAGILAQGTNNKSAVPGPHTHIVDDERSETLLAPQACHCGILHATTSIPVATLRAEGIG